MYKYAFMIVSTILLLIVGLVGYTMYKIYNNPLAIVESQAERVGTTAGKVVKAFKKAKEE